MDEILSFLNDPINKWLILIGFLLLIVAANLLIRIIRSLRNPSSRGVNGANFSNEPMSNSETIGDISMRLGEDVRDVWLKGYSDDQINGVLTGKYTLEDLYTMKPDGNDRVS